MIFHDVTLSPAGEILSRRQHETEALGRQAVEWFGALLQSGGDSFVRPMDATPLHAHIDLRWTAGPGGVALATFEVGDRPYTSSVLLPGRNADADRRGQRVHQQMVARILRLTAPPDAEPGADVLSIRERPVIATTVLLSSRLDPDLPRIAELETLLAAAYFERVFSRWGG